MGAENIIFLLLFLVAFTLFFRNAAKIKRNIFLGKKVIPEGSKSARLKTMLKVALGQSKMTAQLVAAHPARRRRRGVLAIRGDERQKAALALELLAPDLDAPHRPPRRALLVRAVLAGRGLFQRHALGHLRLQHADVHPRLTDRRADQLAGDARAPRDVGGPGGTDARPLELQAIVDDQ